MVLISGDFYKHLTNDVDVVIGKIKKKSRMKNQHVQCRMC